MMPARPVLPAGAGGSPLAWVGTAICTRQRGLQEVTVSLPGSHHSMREKKSPSRNKGQNTVKSCTADPPGEGAAAQGRVPTTDRATEQARPPNRASQMPPLGITAWDMRSFEE